LDRRPRYRWPVVDEVAAASRVIADEPADLQRCTAALPSPAPVAGNEGLWQGMR